MIDGILRGPVTWAVAPVGAALARAGASPNAVTLVGLGFGLCAAAAIALGAPLGAALALIVINRVFDGIDGAVARANIEGRGKSDFGGYLDILCDFIFYGAVPLAFALRDGENALPAAVLLVAFYINGASFLGFAIFAAKRGLPADPASQARGEKSLYFTAGLAEGFETIVIFLAFCLWPGAFAALSFGFAALCLASAGARVMLAYRSFGGDK